MSVLNIPALPWWTFPLLFLTGLAAGFVDSIAGGGGIITLPVLLNLGLPPQLALGTNKLQATFGSASATWHYRAAGLVKVTDHWAGIASTFLGATVGTFCVRLLSSEMLRQVMPWLLVAVAVYLLLHKDFGSGDAPARMSSSRFHLLFGLGIGFYDGFFGPGTGTFWAMAYVLVLGLNLQRATAQTKVMNFTSNTASLLIFGLAGQAHLGAGLCMGLGQLLGARLGSRMVIRRGATWVRPMLISVALAITGRLVWQNFYH